MTDHRKMGSLVGSKRVTRLAEAPFRSARSESVVQSLEETRKFLDVFLKKELTNSRMARDAFDLLCQLNCERYTLCLFFSYVVWARQKRRSRGKDIGLLENLVLLPLGKTKPFVVIDAALRLADQIEVLSKERVFRQEKGGLGLSLPEYLRRYGGEIARTCKDYALKYYGSESVTTCALVKYVEETAGSCNYKFIADLIDYPKDPSLPLPEADMETHSANSVNNWRDHGAMALKKRFGRAMNSGANFTKNLDAIYQKTIDLGRSLSISTCSAPSKNLR